MGSPSSLRARRAAGGLYERALEGNVSCGALVTEIIERRGVTLGLHAPQPAVLQDVKVYDVVNEPDGPRIEGLLLNLDDIRANRSPDRKPFGFKDELAYYVPVHIDVRNL